MWFTDSARRRIGEITRSRQIRYVAARQTRRGRPRDAALDANGTLWVTDSTGAILRIDRERRLRRIPLPRRARPLGITLGPDGAMWFADQRRRRASRITPRGNVTEFALKDRPVAITTGSDGAIWVTTTGGTGDTGLVRVTTGGDTRLFYVRQACNAALRGLTSAPDGSLLFTVANGPVAVGKLDLPRLRRAGQLDTAPAVRSARRRSR